MYLELLYPFLVGPYNFGHETHLGVCRVYADCFNVIVGRTSRVMYKAVLSSFTTYSQHTEKYHHNQWRIQDFWEKAVPTVKMGELIYCIVLRNSLQKWKFCSHGRGDGGGGRPLYPLGSANYNKCNCADCSAMIVWLSLHICNVTVTEFSNCRTTGPIRMFVFW